MRTKYFVVLNGVKNLATFLQSGDWQGRIGFLPSVERTSFYAADGKIFRCQENATEKRSALQGERISRRGFLLLLNQGIGPFLAKRKDQSDDGGNKECRPEEDNDGVKNSVHRGRRSESFATE
jgi:hypothetical protein